MENKFKLKLSNMFRSSFGSCHTRTRNLTDVIDKAVFLPTAVESPPPQKPVAAPRPFPSICRPKCSDPNQKFINESCVISSKDALIPRCKIFERCSPFVKPFNPNGGQTTSPFSPLDPFYDSSKQRRNRPTKKNKKTSKNPKNTDFFKFSSSSFDSSKYKGWWSSSDDDETDTLFSSKSHSSDTSGPRLKRRSRRNGSSASRRRAASSDVGLLPLQGRVKDSFAVVKKSSDPYNDFRTSMVEMIFEKQIFSAKDLEHLLQCFLKLNSIHHHRIIIEVFTEIWEALFSNWGS